MTTDREQGWIVIHRRVRSSPLYRSLTGEQRSVFFTLLLLANWREDRMLHGDEWIVVRRGELAHALKTIAAEAGVGVQVVRTTIEKLLADDSGVGGRGPFLKTRWTNTAGNTGLRLLSIVNYDEYQSRDGEANTAGNTPLTRSQHASNTALTPREQDQQEEQGKQPLAAEAQPFRLEPTGPAHRKAPKPAEADLFFARCQSERVASGRVAEDRPDLPKLRAWFKAACDDLVVDAEPRLFAAYQTFLADQRFAVPDKPFAVFAKGTVWKSRVPPAHPREEPDAEPQRDKWAGFDANDPVGREVLEKFAARGDAAAAAKLAAAKGAAA